MDLLAELLAANRDNYAMSVLSVSRKLCFQLVQKFLAPVESRGKEFPIIHKILFFYYRFSYRGLKMYVNAHDIGLTPILLKNGVWEEFETTLFKKELEKGMNVLDIGANIGWYTLIAAKVIGEKGKVYAFEPEPNNCNLLRKNVQTNSLQNVIIEQKAVTNRCGHIKLFLNPENFGDHRIYDDSDRGSIDIECVALDSYFMNRYEKIDVIKMDIQGAEMFAILGMDTMLKANNKLRMFVEFAPFLLRKNGFSPETFLRRLKNYGFEIYVINDQKRAIELMDINKIIEFCNDKPLDLGVNLYLRKQ